MGTYNQTCRCTAAALSAVHDAQRYEAEAEDLGREMAALSQQRMTLMAKAGHARAMALDGQVAGCLICDGSGKVRGNSVAS